MLLNVCALRRFFRFLLPLNEWASMDVARLDEATPTPSMLDGQQPIIDTSTVDVCFAS